jgi:hypothetical protein
MIKKHNSGALDTLLWLLTAEDNAEDRWSFARFTSTVNQDFSIDYIPTLRSLGVSRDGLEGEITALLALKQFWRLVPRKLFKAFDPDYESLAEEVLKAEFSSPLDARRVEALAIVYRRMRDVYQNGRPRTSLDLNLLSHRELLSKQLGRCRLCRYRFPKHIRDVVAIDDLEDAEERYIAVDNEVTLDRYYRKPALDHILPVFVGGDDIENWQILCASCNAGKGESLSWLFRRGWMPPSKMSDAIKLTTSLRFAGLAAAKGFPEPKDADDGKVLRIFRRNDDRLLYVDNLEVRYL